MYIDRNYTNFTTNRLKYTNCELRQVRTSLRYHIQYLKAYRNHSRQYTSLNLYNFYQSIIPEHLRPPRTPSSPFRIRHWYYLHLRSLVSLYLSGRITSDELHHLHRILKTMATFS